MRILFQGDSITDGNTIAPRDWGDLHDLGAGYPKYAAELIKNKFPDIEFEFINKGMSGHQTKDLLGRLQTDFIDIKPDIVSILVGINDVGHYAPDRSYIPHDVFEGRYREILKAVKEKTNAKIMIIEPFLGTAEDKLYWREDLDPKIQVVRKLAREYADVFIPMDGLLAEAYTNEDPLSYSDDGIHLTPKGAEYAAKIYTEYISRLITEPE